VKEGSGVADTEMENRVSYKASEMNDSVEKEIERLRGQLMWAWEKEGRNLGWFGLRDGMEILEVGSGPGFVTEKLLEMCPASHVTCVEIDPDLIGPAEEYLRGKGLGGRYTIIEGDVAKKIECADNRFDFAYARLVFQHLRDPRGAVREIRRVLKSGGKLVILDIDVGLGEIYEPRNAEAEAIEERMHEGRATRGGNPRIGRELWRMLGESGFVNMDLEAVAVHSDKTGTAALFPEEWDAGEFRPMLAAGIITEEDVETMHRAHLAMQGSKDKYALFVSLMVGGEKEG
jgi:ubiquinone/menaquinone biosynthesis C-methylase UbiE